MTWGEVQSVIQLAAALNAIYLGLRDIRNPYVRREQAALAEQTAAWKSAPAATDIGEQINNNHVLLTTRLATFDQRDALVAVACVSSVGIYAVLLIVSAFYYGTSIWIPFDSLMCIVGFVPIATGLVLNLLLVKDLRTSVSANRGAIDRLFALERQKKQQTPDVQACLQVPGTQV